MVEHNLHPDYELMLLQDHFNLQHFEDYVYTKYLLLADMLSEQLFQILPSDTPEFINSGNWLIWK